MKITNVKLTFNYLTSIRLFLLFFIVVSCGQHKLNLDDGTAISGADNIPNVSNRSTNVATLTMNSTVQPGTYASAPNFNLTLSTQDSSSQIKYCINTGATETGDCCNPETQGQSYNGKNVAGVLGSTDGDYCLSYIGYTDYQTSAVGQVLIKIDSNVPQMDITSTTRTIQSNEIFDISFDSPELGNAGLFFTLLNYNSTQGTNCDDINSNANFLTNGIDFDSDSSPDSLDMSGEAVSYSALLRSKTFLNYGENFLYYSLTDSTQSPVVSSCAGINVVLNDFDIFEFSSGANMAINANDEFEFIGGFNSYGTGAYGGSVGTTTLEVGLIKIIN